MTTETLHVKPGYFRYLNNTVNVHRCPDAGENCGGKSDCRHTASGCWGGDSSDLCRPGLTGIFCLLCSKADEHYVAAKNANEAHCAPCKDTLWTTISILAGSCTAALLVAYACWHFYHRRLSSTKRQKLHFVLETFSVFNKLKILIGFYMISTQIGAVYEVSLPADVQLLLQRMSIIITLGLELGLERVPL